jgi:NAD(P)-dependent dehydrogenase (short-subunit alcohol dehydrogenase family)
MQLARTSCVLLVGRTERDLAATCAEIQEAGGTAAYYVGDVGEPNTATEAIAKVRQLGWTLQYVICNAGMGKSSPTHTLKTAQWHAAFDVNVHSNFYFVQAALPLFVERHSGTFCFINSLAGVKAYAYEAAYVASKHAAVGLAESLALEYGKQGITSVAICPGFVAGSMTDRTIKSLAGRRNISEREAREVIEHINPQRRIIPAQEIADMVEFVCSGKAPSLAGNPIIMSGGA